MSESLFRLIVGVTAGAVAITEAVIVYLKPKHYEKIAAALPIVEGAITEVCSLFAV